jgi:hypothetical protein
MKAIVKATAALALTALSVSSFAEKVTITGSPVVLEQKGEVYVVPADFAAPTTDYYYVTIGDKNRVCYLEKQPALESVDLMTVKVNVKGTDATWNCYDTNPEYFVVTP